MSDISLTLDPPRSRRRRGWLFTNQEGTKPGQDHAPHGAHAWYLVLWLTGVDYFSTLGYQPGIALLAAHATAPIATAVLVLVTLFCALPIYAQVARRSYVGQGSIAMLENLLEGWYGRLFVLVLLGFAATDFVITMTLSAADAAQHAVENPLLHDMLEGHQMSITLGLLALLAAVFLKGFGEAISVAALVAVPYLVLNAIVLGRGMMEIMQQPYLWDRWRQALFQQHGDYTGILVASILIFPRLALGLSGFETGVSVMPLIRGSHKDSETEVPHGRISNTRWLLASAAILMSGFLIVSSLVTTLLIPESAYREGGKASGRAIAYLAHQMLGSGFGSVYDFSTILILWFAGASAMAGLLSLVPRYLPRLGLAPQWVAYSRPLILLLFVASVIVTVVFRANVEAQGGAYATGVLVLMLSAAIAAAIAAHKDGATGLSFYCWLVAAVFAYTLVDNVIERPDGLIIASCFIATIMLTSLVSRWQRATELRVAKLTFCDIQSHRLWQGMCGKKVNLVPTHLSEPEARQKKAAEIRLHYKIDGPLAFITVKLLDNRSEFLAPLNVQVEQDCDNYVIVASQAIAVANTISYMSELLDPISIFLSLTRGNRVQQSLRYLLLGEGETGLMVYHILLRHWDATPEDDVRPFIFLMSD